MPVAAPVAPVSEYPKVFYHPLRPRLRVLEQGKTSTFIKFDHGRAEALNASQEASLRAECGATLFEEDIPKDAPDLVAQTGWRTRSQAALNDYNARLISKIT